MTETHVHAPTTDEAGPRGELCTRTLAMPADTNQNGCSETQHDQLLGLSRLFSFAAFGCCVLLCTHALSPFLSISTVALLRFGHVNGLIG